jgi:hypothetical protein
VRKSSFRSRSRRARRRRRTGARITRPPDLGGVDFEAPDQIERAESRRGIAETLLFLDRRDEAQALIESLAEELPENLHDQGTFGSRASDARRHDRGKGDLRGAQKSASRVVFFDVSALKLTTGVVRSVYM